MFDRSVSLDSSFFNYSLHMHLKFQRFAAFTLVAVLALLPISAFSATKVTPGSSCKAVKQKVVYLNMVYTCTQVGKKKVWSKGVAVVKEMPIPAPTPTPTPTSSPTLNENIIDQCLKNIGDAKLSKEIFLSIIGITESDLLNHLGDSSWFITLATSGGEFGINHSMSTDIYCGNSQNNFVKYLDANDSSKDYFFGGAGTDTVDTSWNSEFYGGDGSDSIGSLLEKSIFYGGEGNDICLNLSNDSKFNQETVTAYPLRPAPLPMPKDLNVVTDATRYIQTLINNTSIIATSNKTKIEMHIEPGKNGPYPEISERALSVALNFYASLGMPLPQETIHVLMGRTQGWLREQANLYAPGCVNASYFFDTGASLCAYPTRSAVYIQMPRSITMNGSVPDDVDLSDLKVVLSYTNMAIIDSFASGTPHEALHAWQDGNYGNAGSDMPKWLWEGGASLFAEMVVQKMKAPSQVYSSYNPSANSSWNKKVCSGPVETMKPVCEYTQGQVVMEYFLYKYGVDAYIRLITQSRDPKFAVNFQKATGVPLLNFYSEVNVYLTLKEWNK